MFMTSQVWQFVWSWDQRLILICGWRKLSDRPTPTSVWELSSHMCMVPVHLGKIAERRLQSQSKTPIQTVGVLYPLNRTSPEGLYRGPVPDDKSRYRLISEQVCARSLPFHYSSPLPSYKSAAAWVKWESSQLGCGDHSSDSSHTVCKHGKDTGSSVGMRDYRSMLAYSTR